MKSWRVGPQKLHRAGIRGSRCTPPSDALGLIGNRMLHGLWREVVGIVDRGIASVEDVDAVAKMNFGLRLPVVEAADCAGIEAVA